ncbi:hypothetical protein [Desulfitobacterium hafniense]|nr:hypothetical protein [Desulfitobacterium hafniense]
MSELLKRYQGMIFEMYLSGRITEDEFNLLSALSEGMEADEKAVELVTKILPNDIKDQDIIDCILARQFKTALMMLE